MTTKEFQDARYLFREIFGLDLLARHGFNYILLNIYAHDTNWRKGNTGPDDYGPPLLYPWNGNNDQPDHSRMNLAFWHHFDRVMTAMMDRGIQAHLYTKVYNKNVNWPEENSDADRQYYRWLIARYAAYPNVIWDYCKEAQRDKQDLAYSLAILSYIKENDPYQHLRTVHDDDAPNDSGAYDELTDFRADQHHGNSTRIIKNSNRIGTNHEKILIQRQRRAWPVANVESDYECGPGGITDKTFGGDHATPDDTIRTLWDIAMAGGYTAYYYTYTAWDIIRPLDEPQGYTYMKHFGEFWRSTEYWKLDPSDSLVDHGWCLAQPGREYVVYQREAQPFTLKIAEAKSTLAGQWFNPLTGKRRDAGTFKNGSAKITPPPDWGDAPLVLYLKGK